MSDAFRAHVEALDMDSPEAAELMAAAPSQAALLAYAKRHDLPLAPEDAEAMAARAGSLDDSDLAGVAGGFNVQGASTVGMTMGELKKGLLKLFG